MGASYQDELEVAVSKLSEEEAKDLLMEIASSLPGFEGDNERSINTISDIIKRILD